MAQVYRKPAHSTNEQCTDITIEMNVIECKRNVQGTLGQTLQIGGCTWTDIASKRNVHGWTLQVM